MTYKKKKKQKEPTKRKKMKKVNYLPNLRKKNIEILLELLIPVECVEVSGAFGFNVRIHSHNIYLYNYPLLVPLPFNPIINPCIIRPRERQPETCITFSA